MHSQTSGNISITRPVRLDNSEIVEICHEVNAIYLEEESEIWPHDGTYYRINKKLLNSYLANNEIFILRSDNRIASIIRLYNENGKRYFGMLSSFRNYRKMGFARLLVQHIEKEVLDEGEQELWIELLFCRDVSMSNKTRLFEWYSSMGYEKMKVVDFLSVHPEKADVIQKQCDFMLMRKPLT